MNNVQLTTGEAAMSVLPLPVMTKLAEGWCKIWHRTCGYPIQVLNLTIRS